MESAHFASKSLGALVNASDSETITLEHTAKQHSCPSWVRNGSSILGYLWRLQVFHDQQCV